MNLILSLFSLIYNYKSALKIQVKQTKDLYSDSMT